MAKGTKKKVFAPSFTGAFRWKTNDEVHFIFNAARKGLCHVCTKPPTNWVRSHGLREGSGYVFNSNGSARWTDNISWSDSAHPGRDRKRNTLMIYNEIHRDPLDMNNRHSRIENGLIKTVISDKSSPLKIIYYHRRRPLLEYGKLVFHTYNQLRGFSNCHYSQADVDGAFLLLSIGDPLSYHIPSGLLHSEWRKKIKQQRKQRPFVKRKKNRNATVASKNKRIQRRQSSLSIPKSPLHHKQYQLSTPPRTSAASSLPPPTLQSPQNELTRAASLENPLAVSSSTTISSCLQVPLWLRPSHPNNKGNSAENYKHPSSINPSAHSPLISTTTECSCPHCLSPQRRSLTLSHSPKTPMEHSDDDCSTKSTSPSPSEHALQQLLFAM
eukprot:m.169285 g.169285  ORF g.169285 m.169285 type:complete len:383 (-) comp13478_c1_seq3:2106-3254(-)